MAFPQMKKSTGQSEKKTNSDSTVGGFVHLSLKSLFRPSAQICFSAGHSFFPSVLSSLALFCITLLWKSYYIVILFLVVQFILVFSLVRIRERDESIFCLFFLYQKDKTKETMRKPLMSFGYVTGVSLFLFFCSLSLIVCQVSHVSFFWSKIIHA